MFFFSPISPYFQPWDNAQSDVTPLWHNLLLSSKKQEAADGECHASRLLC